MEKKIYKAILNTMSDLVKVGISKDRRNAQQGYNFRGIDDMYNVVSPILVKNKIVILPEVIEWKQTERTTKSGNGLIYTAIKVSYHLVCTEDNSEHIITTYGEAMDSADKSTNKAMSAAYKYAFIQVFCIPTKGEDNDADSTTAEESLPQLPKEFYHEADQAKSLIELQAVCVEWKKHLSQAQLSALRDYYHKREQEGLK